MQTLSNRPGRGLPRANLGECAHIVELKSRNNSVGPVVEGELEEWLYGYDAAEEARKALDSELLLHLAKL